jgi:DNA-binding CsgD family transcriptional regulator
MVNRLILPLLVVVVLVAQSLPANSAVHEAGVALVVFVTAGAALFGITVTLTLAGTGEASPWLAAGAPITAYALGRLGGLGFDCLFSAPETASPAYQTAMTILLAIMLVAVIVDSWSAARSSAAEGTPTGSSAAALLRTACLEIARIYNLTPRESEVLGLLARGYTSTVIAHELVISENTVRTHMKSIYRKLGVSSRDEVFAKVDAWKPAAS